MESEAEIGQTSSVQQTKLRVEEFDGKSYVLFTKPRRLALLLPRGSNSGICCFLAVVAEMETAVLSGYRVTSRRGIGHDLLNADIDKNDFDWYSDSFSRTLDLRFADVPPHYGYPRMGNHGVRIWPLRGH